MSPTPIIAATKHTPRGQPPYYTLTLACGRPARFVTVGGDGKQRYLPKALPCKCATCWPDRPPRKKTGPKSAPLTGRTIGRIRVGELVALAERHRPNVTEYHCTCLTCGRRKQCGGSYLRSSLKRADFRGGCSHCSALEARAADRAKSPRLTRDAAILARLDAGETCRVLSDEYGISRQRVFQIAKMAR